MLGTPCLTELPLGHVKPQGWLLNQLRLQAAGQTGQLEEIWSDVGPNSAWLGGEGEDWERGPYYLDGLVPLAYVLDDNDLKAKARKWIDWILASQRSDGQFGPLSNDDWWPRMVALKALTQYADATSDDRVMPFLRRYFVYQMEQLPSRPLQDWGRARGADNVLSVLWLYRRDMDDRLLLLAKLLLQQTADWHTFLTGQLQPGPTLTFDHLTHGPNVAMGLKTPAVAHLLDGDPSHRTRVEEMMANLDRLHGMVHGVFSGDEWLGGRAPHHGVETCQVVELMFTLEQLHLTFGDGRHADQLEQVAFNLLASANDPAMLAHQYHQQANQVHVSVARRDWSFSGDDANIFGLEPNFGCCTANLHQGWPKFVRSLWMRTQEGGLSAVSYAPCTVSTRIGEISVELDIRTDYPFEETVNIILGVDQPVSFPMRLRIPGWCSNAAISVNGSPTALPPILDGYITVDRQWLDGDTVQLTLPMRLTAISRDNGAAGLRLGPLVLALGIGENWCPVAGAPGLAEWEIHPRKSWNFGLWLGSADSIGAWPVARRKVGPIPFALASAPIHVYAQGALLPQWELDGGSTAALPVSPVETTMPVHQVALVPYGSARLRIAEFPVIAPDGAR